MYELLIVSITLFSLKGGYIAKCITKWNTANGIPHLLGNLYDDDKSF